MDVRFDMVYDTICQRLVVSQDGNPVSSYSQFSRCNGQPFLNWYKKLPQYCFFEANNSYTVTLESSPVFVEILSSIFLKDINCHGVRIKKEIILESHRMRWADELLEASGFSVPAICVPVCVQCQNVRFSASPIFVQMDVSGKTWCIPGLRRLEITLQLGNTESPAVAILTDEAEVAALSKGSYPAVVAILFGEQEFAFIQEEQGVFLFSCCSNYLAEFLKEWVLSFYLSPVLAQLQQRLSGVQCWNGIDAELANAKRELLTARKPYMQLKLPSKIELHSTEKFSFAKLPEDMHCKAHSNHPDIALLEKGNIIKPQCEGMASFTVTVQDHPELSITQSTIVYRYIEVTQIQLSVSKSVVQEGERLTINSVFYPAGAHNVGQARWTMLPDTILRPESNGVFQAVKQGCCSIRITVGTVTETISVTVLAKPRGISFDQSDVAVKLGDTSQYIRVNILPIGSQGGQVQYRISDTNILQINTKTGQMIPLAEGNVIVTADLMNHGALIDSANCHVTVLPPKDIVTPDSALIILILSLLAVIVLYTTPYWVIPGIAAISSAIWYAIRKKSTVVTVLSIIFSLILCALLFGNL